MKKLLWGICFLMGQQIVVAQSKTVFLISDPNGLPVANASIQLGKTGLFMADDKGRFTLRGNQQGLLKIKVSCIGFIAVDSLVLLPQDLIKITMQPSSLFLDPIEIKAIRAGDKAPFAKSNLGKQDIEHQNLGQDIPFILNQTPSVNITSDAGNGVGYTAIRIRGTDATRINVTVNGIPYNDAESQGSYFVDLPDISSSVNSIQIQRGVGTSSNGAGAFGGSINLSTNEYNENAYAEVNNSYGSFNTWKNTVKLGSGLLNHHFTIDARLSRVASDGFIDRANSDLKSFYLSTAYISKKSSFRFNIISGKEKTYQAWNGIPEYKLFYNKDSLMQHYYNNLGYLYFNAADSVNLFTSNPRKYNVFTYPNQTDNYQQDHYQFFFNHSFDSTWSLSTAVYLSKGKGYYEEYKTAASYSNYGLANPVIGNQIITNTDLVRQLWLDNNLYGTIYSVNRKTKKDQLTLGGGWNEYDGLHYGNIVWANIGIPNDYQYYNHKAVKKDFNVYGKYLLKISRHLEATADVQYRRVNYNINGTQNYPDLLVDDKYNFFNPKLGLSYSAGSLLAYVSYAVANKEPNNTDYETGTAAQPPKSEHLSDFEWGIGENKYKFSWNVNGYFMNYKDQLVLTGKINDVGNGIRINVPQSYRAGIELQGRYSFNKMIQLSANLTISQNKIKNFSDYVPQYDASFNLVKQDTFFYSKPNLAFSPAVIGSGLLQVFPFNNTEIDLTGKYVGKQYMDNTSSETKSIRGYFVQDFRLQYTVHKLLGREIVLIAQAKNIWDKQYESNGYTYSYIYAQSLVKENFYYPMAGRNFMLAINMKF
jgi:iron complex outermembrane receptor protein